MVAFITQAVFIMILLAGVGEVGAVILKGHKGAQGQEVALSIASMLALLARTWSLSAVLPSCNGRWRSQRTPDWCLAIHPGQCPRRKCVRFQHSLVCTRIGTLSQSRRPSRCSMRFYGSCGCRPGKGCVVCKPKRKSTHHSENGHSKSPSQNKWIKRRKKTQHACFLAVACSSPLPKG